MKKLGKFEILEQIGKGAMGVVYKARDPFIGRLVALKTITTGLAEDPALLERFYQEARSAGALEHPNIVTVFELGKEGDTPFIAMAFLEGGSLDKLIEARPVLPLSQKLGYIVYVCRALEYAHKRGVVHRDIKPGNVMVTADGIVKVVDFGIARLGDTGRTQTGTLIGTLGYMSPQLIGGKTADARSDIWAVGVMFYELLAYQRPFSGENHVALMMNIHSQPTPSILEAAPGTPPDVAEVVERMLRKEVDERFQSMDEVLIELEPIWKRLQQAEVSVLVADSKQLFEARDLGRAQDVLRKALLIDTANTQAKNLLEKINADIRRREIIPQVKGRVERGQNLLAAGQFEEAKLEAEAALHLDSTFLPARELLAQVQNAAERARALAQALRATKQRLAEGAITEAELQLTKVLEIDAANIAAQDLLKQIRDEKSRRENQRRLSETLHRARAFWTELRYDECIQLLLDAQQKFPGEREVDKLLETTRQDKAEQERQKLLTEARSFLRNQQFDEALRVLEGVLGHSPADSTATNLRMLALQGREQQIRERQLREDLASLRALVKDGKFQEAIDQGEALLRESPKEFELGELVAYARGEHIQREEKRKLDQWVDKVNQEIRSSHFQDAIQAAKSGLAEFPRDLALMLLLESAKKKQEEKEKREVLEQRIKEVRARINRQELTGAMDLARQTLAAFGPDTDINQLLHQAEMEHEQRAKKNRDQQETFEAARTLVDARKFDDATVTLQQAVATQLISNSDPRLGELLHEIAQKQTPPPLAAPPAAPEPHAPAPAPLSPSWTSPTGDPGKDYVYQRTPPLPDATHTADRDSATSVFSATSVTGPPTQPPPPTALPQEKKAPHEPGNSKPWRQTPESPDHFDATRIARPAAPRREVVFEPQAPQLEEFEGDPVAGQQTVSHPAVVEERSQKSRKGPVSIGLIASAILILAGVWFLVRNPKVNPKPPTVVEIPKTSTNPASPTGGSTGQVDPVVPVPPTPVAGTGVTTKPPTSARGADPTPLKKVPEVAPVVANPVINQPPQPPSGPPPDRVASLRSLIDQGNFPQARQALPTLNEWRTEHDSILSQIDSGERNFVSQARTQVTSATTSGDANSLNRLMDKLRLIASSGGPAAIDARDLAERVIPDSLKSIAAAKDATDRFNQAVNDFNQDAKDASALTARVQPEFQRILDGGGPYSDKAREYVTAIIPGAIAKLNPPSRPSLMSDDRKSIASVLDQYKAAYNQRKIEELKAVLPGMDGKTVAKIDGTFKTAKSIVYDLQYNAADFLLSGDGTTATAEANYSESITMGGQKNNISGKITFHLKKKNATWSILSYD